MNQTHKSGFVNIIGNPNVGKSTLMNVLVGERLSIISPKAQTTRHRIIGLVNDDNYQIVFSDTPGLLKPHYELHNAMMSFSLSALDDADILIYMTDTEENIEPDADIARKINSLEVPLIVVINKIDISNQDSVLELHKKWTSYLPKAEVIGISAINQFNTDVLLKRIIELLPQGEAYFPKDQLTDKQERFFVAEIIREKIFFNYQKEIPYCTEVVVEEFLESEDFVRIRAIIHVMRESQKAIILGNKGLAIKKVGTEARLAIEHFTGKKIHLELYVKVTKDWREKPMQLKRFGYLIN